MYPQKIALYQRGNIPKDGRFAAGGGGDLSTPKAQSS